MKFVFESSVRENAQLRNLFVVAVAGVSQKQIVRVYILYMNRIKSESSEKKAQLEMQDIV